VRKYDRGDFSDVSESRAIDAKQITVVRIVCLFLCRCDVCPDFSVRDWYSTAISNRVRRRSLCAPGHSHSPRCVIDIHSVRPTSTAVQTAGAISGQRETGRHFGAARL